MRPLCSQCAQANKSRSAGVVRCRGAKVDNVPVINLERYVLALITFVANKLLRSATAPYQRRFYVNVTERRIPVLLASRRVSNLLARIKIASFEYLELRLALDAIEQQRG